MLLCLHSIGMWRIIYVWMSRDGDVTIILPINLRSIPLLCKYWPLHSNYSAQLSAHLSVSLSCRPLVCPLLLYYRIIVVIQCRIFVRNMKAMYVMLVIAFAFDVLKNSSLSFPFLSFLSCSDCVK
jgi:hypothetical protein